MRVVNYKRIKSILLILFISTLVSFIPYNKTIFNSPIKNKIAKEFINVKEDVDYKSNQLVIKLDKDNYQYIEDKYNVDVTSLGSSNYLVDYKENDYKLEDILNILNEDENVTYAEPDYKFTAQLSQITEPYYDNQWAFNNVNYGINITDIWSRIVGKQQVVVAVLDTGINYDHPDLENIVWQNSGEIPSNGIDDDSNGYIDDYQGWDFANENNEVMDTEGHGTHIAGIIAGEVNDIGIAGVSPNVKVMGLKVASPSGDYYLSDVLAGINYAIAKGVKIFNFSFGGTTYIQSFKDLINSSNALFICAAGNGGVDQVGDDNDITPFYPASYDSTNIISVAATNNTGRLTNFSNYGLTSVDIGAPGNNIYSSYLGTSYQYMSGTSMAAPFVAGIASILYSENTSIDLANIKQEIIDGVNVTGFLSGKVATSGIVDTKTTYNSFVSSYAFSGGSGTVEDPYLIDDAKELNAIRNFLDASFKLTSNINLAYDVDDQNIYTDELGWLPIGTDTEPFTGTLDGNGYKIINLTINRPDTSYLGVFGYADFSTNISPNIYNLTVETNEINGKDYVSGFIGYGNNAYLKDVSVNTKITSTGNYTGGVIGYSTLGVKENVISNGIISSTGDYVGGISGYLEGNITKSYNTANITGISNIGGLSGYVNGDITDVFNMGMISEGATSSSIGGITGDLVGNLNNSYNIGVLDFGTNSSSIGFITGSNTGTITNSYYYNPYSFINNSYGTELTKEQTYNYESYVGFDFVDDWEVLSGNSLPTLKNIDFQLLTGFDTTESLKVVLTNPNHTLLQITNSPVENIRYSYTYTSSNEEIIEVSKTGELIPIGIGTATITVTSLELNTSLEVSVEVIEGIKGDVNGDYNVTMTDLVILRRFLAELETITDETLLYNADVNSDDAITLTDLVKIRRFLAGLEDL